MVVDVPSGALTPLPAGAPDTGKISGHLCWIGDTGRILFTGAPGVAASEEDRRGLYDVAPGDAAARHVVAGEPFNHVAASDDGQFFIVDNYRSLHVVVGSIATGDRRVLCASQTRQGRPQHTHVHPYMTPDNRHVIFNSNVTGVSQVYVARIPEGFLAQLQEGADTGAR
jgi:6-phosphogluconolactonase (cycloisomerase 2 family)